MSIRWLLSGLFLCLGAISAYSQVTQKVFNLASSHRELLDGTIDPALCPNPPDDCHCKPSNSWDAGYTGVFKEGSYVGKNSGGGTVEFMNWRMVYPLNYNPTNPSKYPMIIMLHGAGEGGRVWTGNFNYTPTNVNYDNNGRNITHGGQEHRDAVARNPSLSNSFPGIVIWPQSSYNGAWEGGWDNGVQSDNTRMAAEIIEYMIRERNVDPDRITIHGLSNGAQGVWDLAAKRPDLFCSVLAMSGVGTNLTAAVNALVTTPIWIFQGSVDSNPNPSASLDWTNAFNNAGGNMTRTVYQGVGHGTWPLAYAEPTFFPWIKSKTKKDIYVFGGTPSVCPGGQLKLGFSANFLAYQWTKDGADIPGATSRYYSATASGNYAVKYQRRTDGTWATSNPLSVTASTSSPFTPVLTNTGSTFIPVNVIGTTQLASVKNFVYLNAPGGFTSYQWYKNGNLVATTPGNQRLISQDAGSSGDAGNYSVKTVSGCVSNMSNVITVTWHSPQPLSPQPAKASTVTLSETSLRVNWTDYTGEVQYEIWRYRHSTTYGEQNWTQVATLPANTTTFVDTGLRPEGYYKYSIRAILTDGSAIMSPEGPDSWGRPSVDAIPPTAPSGLVASNITDTGLTLSWTASTDNDMVYKYEIYNGSSLLQTVTGNINGTPATATTVDLTGLSPLTTYFLNVRALDFKGNYSAFAEGTSVTTTGPLNGLKYKYYTFTGTMPGTAGAQLVEPRANNSFDFSQTPAATGVTATVDIITPPHQEDNFVFAFDGFIEILTTGVYTFYTSSDDGSRLYVNGTLVVNNDGAHGTQEKSGTFNFTSTGKYPIRITFFEQGGGNILTASYTATGISKRQLPADRLYQNGTTIANFYSASTGDLDNVNTWWSDANGTTGSHPLDFTGPQTIYNVTNRTSASLTNAWTVSGSGSKVVVGSGTAITLDLNAAFTGTMDAGALAVINVNNSAIPKFGVLAANSTVNFSPGANSTIPNAIYGNVNLLTANQYTIPMANTMIQGNLNVSNGVTTTGTATNLSRLVVAGDITFSNSSNPLPAAGANQYSIIFTGGKTHTMSFNTAVDPSFFVIQTDVGDVVNFVNGSGRTYTVGSTLGGGIVNKGVINLGDNNLVVNGRGSINPNNETGSFSVNGGSITLNTTATLNSNLSFDATNNVLTNLSVSLPSTYSVNLLTPAVVNKLASVGGGGSIITGDGNLKLTSTETGTAHLGPLGNGSKVNGNIISQRYMNAKGAKVYRYLSMPVKGVRIADLQAFFPVTGDFTGADVIAGNGPSMYDYDEPTNGYHQFPTVGGTNQDTLRTARGYSVYIRETATPTTWQVKGAPNQGTITYPLTPGTTASNGYNLLGNPYPAPIKWTGNSTGGWTLDGVNNTISVRENVSATVYRWRTWNGSSGNLPDGLIAQGQAFWVQTTTSNPSLIVAEAAKQTTDGSFYRTGEPPNVIAVKMKSGSLEDDTYIQFAREANQTFDKDLDAPKLANSYFNLSTLSSEGKSLAINLTTTGECDQTVSFRIANAANGNYELTLSGVKSLIANDQVIFTDSYTNTQLAIVDTYTHNFSITADAASKADGRFKLKFIKPDVALDNTLMAEAGCNDGNPVVLVNASQPGVDYTAFVDGVAVSEPFVGTGGNLAVAIDHTKVPYGKTHVMLKAGFLGCTQNDLTNTINVNRDTVELPKLIMNEGVLKVSNLAEVASYRWLLGEDTLDIATPEYTPVDSGVYKVQITKASCVLTSNEIEKKALHLDMALTTEEVCNTDAEVTIEETQEGAEYRAYLGATEASPAVVGTGGPLTLTLNSDVITSGSKDVRVKAGFENDIPQFLASTVTVRRDVLVTPQVVVDGNTLTTTPGATSYAWYRNGELLDSDTGNAIEAPEDGSYYVLVSNGKCSGQSAPVSYSVTGLGESGGAFVSMSPNPARTRVLVVAGKTIQPAAVRLTSTVGQAFNIPVSMVTDRSVELDVRELSAGFYLVHVNGQVVRLVKE